MSPEARTCWKCAFSYAEPDDNLVCGHSTAGRMGLYVYLGPTTACGKNRDLFKLHPRRATPEELAMDRTSVKLKREVMPSGNIRIWVIPILDDYECQGTVIFSGDGENADKILSGDLRFNEMGDLIECENYQDDD